MRKFNKNLLLFAFAAVFIVCGLWGGCLGALWQKTVALAVGVKHGESGSFSAFTSAVEDSTSERLRYHDGMMDVNSLRENLLGTRVVFKDDITVVKADSGSLTSTPELLTQAEIGETVDRIAGLYEVCEQYGAEFLYCAAPAKEYYEENPENAENHFRENFSRFLSEMERRQIPFLDLTDAFRERQLEADALFYYTDHHWRTGAAFVAAGSICEALQARYGFPMIPEVADLGSYRVETYPDWFLGSKGKKVGTFFTFHGADDFELITPDFPTDLTESRPFANDERRGSFEDSVLFMGNMRKDYYGVSTYVTYSGGDFRLQIMKNNLKPEGKKILMIRDSYACAVAPFLALQTGELHLCDMRDSEWYVGDKLNAEEYIRELQPDYVLVLYSGVSSVAKSSGKYDFF